jgi:isopenicillin N synthase-like dioxygenase
MKISNVPTIDFLSAKTDPSQLKLLDSACRDHGFFLLKNHGMKLTINNMWKASEWFFQQPRKDKLGITRTESIPLGYYDRELTKQKRDLKEVFDFMQPKVDGEDFNQWPEDQDFRDVMLQFFKESSSVAAQTLDLIFYALNNDQIALPVGESKTSNARLNFYPISDPLDSSDQAKVSKLGDMALHHHTDPGILTLLLQDMTGGLQAKSKGLGWIDIEPKKDTIVVNLGDAMQVWTNDQYVAAIHRVIKRTNSPRYSTPYFYNPKSNAILKPVEGLSSQSDLYSSFTWKEYIQGRVNDNYEDLGEDDIQIERFKVS